MSNRSFARRVRHRVARTAVRGLELATGGRQIPLDIVRAVRLLGSDPNTLVPVAHRVDGSQLPDPRLAAELEGVVLGEWALGPKALAVVARVIAHQSPSLIIEFGSGVSTIALAHAIRDLPNPSSLPRVISLEQDPLHAETTRRMLAKAGLDREVNVVVAPLADQTIEGVQTTCYELPDDFDAILSGRKAGFILVDGPSAGDGGRFGTIPLIRPFAASEARFLLDDALRDSELEIARRWRRLPYITVTGIRPIEKGLLSGIVRGQ